MGAGLAGGFISSPDPPVLARYARPGATPPKAITHRLQPGDLVYAGAFRLPDVAGDHDWEYSGHTLTYYPGGDITGAGDGYPGSLFATGHNWYQHVAEISIPQPVISPGKRLADLNRARMLQPFHNIRGDLYDFDSFEIPPRRARLSAGTWRADERQAALLLGPALP